MIKEMNTPVTREQVTVAENPSKIKDLWSLIKFKWKPGLLKP